MWPSPTNGFKEGPCSVPFTAGLGCSFLPRQPQCPASLSHHTARASQGSRQGPPGTPGASQPRPSGPAEDAPPSSLSLGFPCVLSERGTPSAQQLS